MDHAVGVRESHGLDDAEEEAQPLGPRRGPGGVLVEIANQASVRLGPVDEAEARAMLNETAAGKLLGGVRGKPPCDIDAAARAIAAFSRIGAAQIDRLSALEINPLIVGPRGAAGVDVLLEAFSEK